MSERVERKILGMLRERHISPYGNPIPGLDELGEEMTRLQFRDGVRPMTEVVTDEPTSVVVRRVGEPAQADQEALSVLTSGGITPDAKVEIHLEGDRVLARAEGSDAVSLPRDVAMHVFVDSD